MRNRGLASGGAFDWFFQRISGIILGIMLAVHFILLHFSGVELTFQGVSEHLSQPSWLVFNLMFLVLGTSHAINGFFMLLHDYVQNNLWRGILTGTLWTLGILMIVIGSMTIFRVQPLTVLGGM
jgi:succinate dehydrogenase / fumarate reductase, membrane anchor subunit